MRSQKQEVSSYRWVIVASGFLIQFIFGGLFNSFGVFLKPLAEEFGWSRAAISGAFSLNMVLQGSLGIAAGSISDKHGPRWLVASGIAIAGLGYVLVSLTSNLWHLYMFFGFIVGAGVSTIWSPVTATVSRWFRGRRGLALGVVTSGVGLGMIVMPPLINHLITSFGWRWSFVILGLMFWVIAIPAALLLKPEPSGMALSANSASNGEAKEAKSPPQTGFSAREALVLLPFWLLAISQLFYSIPRQTVIVHIVPNATDVGISPGAAALILTLIGVGNVAGRLAIGHLSDLIGGKRTIIICFLVQAVALFTLIPAASLGAFYSIALIYGMTSSAILPTFVRLATEFFGLRFAGTIISLWYAAISAGAAVGPFFAGWVFDATRSYVIAYLVGGVFLLMATGLVIASRAPGGAIEERQRS